MVPEGAALLDLEAVGEGLAGRNAGKADPGHAVHLVGQDDPVPVDGGRLAQSVGDTNRDFVALAPAQRRGRNRPVDGGRHAGRAREVHRQLGDFEAEFGAAQHRRAGAGGRRLGRPRVSTQLRQAQHDAACRQAVHETAA